MSVAQQQLNFIETGTGQNLIMLHGWNRSLHDLKPLAEILSSYAKVFVIDLPGFGKTPPPPLEGWDTNQYAELILEFIRRNNLEKVILLGHSFGGRISLRICAKHPELIEKLILIDSHGLKPVRSLYQHIRIFFIKKAANLIKSTDRTFGTNIYKEKFAKKYGSPDYQNAGVLKNTFVKTISEDQQVDVQNIKTKALLLWGSEDKETPLEMGKKFNKLLVNSKLIILEGKDHSPFHGIGSHLCANHIINFLNSN